MSSPATNTEHDGTAPKSSSATCGRPFQSGGSPEPSGGHGSRSSTTRRTATVSHTRALENNSTTSLGGWVQWTCGRCRETRLTKTWSAFSSGLRWVLRTGKTNIYFLFKHVFKIYCRVRMARSALRDSDSLKAGATTRTVACVFCPAPLLLRSRQH